MIKFLLYVLNSILIIIICNCNYYSNVKDNLYSHISYLASDDLKGRLPCTEGDSLAVNYITQYFESLDLKTYPTCKDYLQPFPYLTDIINEKSLLKYSINNHEIILTPNIEYSIRSNSADGNNSTEVVFIGYGIHSPENGYDDFSKVGLSNKIVIYYLVSPKDASDEIRKLSKELKDREVAKLAKELGAVATVFVMPPPFKDKFPSKKARSRISQRIKKGPIPNLRLSYETFNSIMTNCGIDINKINQNLKTSKSSLAIKIPNLEMSFDIKTKYIYKNAHNIIGYLTGKDTSKTMVIGAHYDHIGIQKFKDHQDSIRNGADDNASGTSLILEFARYYSENKPRSNLCFVAFGAEESGHNGSNYFVENFPFKSTKLSLMLNFDMIGRLRNDSLYTYGISSFPDLSKLISDQFSHKFNLIFPEKTSGSDDIPFSKIDVPTLSIFTGLHSDYHQTSDEINKINLEGLLKIYDFGISIINKFSKKIE